MVTCNELSGIQWAVGLQHVAADLGVPWQQWEALIGSAVCILPNSLDQVLVAKDPVPLIWNKKMNASDV